MTTFITTGDGPSLQELFHDAVTGMAVVDLEGRFRALNPSMCRMLGYRDEELIGTRPVDITHPDDRERSEQTMNLLLSGQTSADRVRKRYLRSDGSPVLVVRTTTSLRTGSGEVLGLLTQAVNLSDMAEVEERLRRSESRFRALVAHSTEMTVLLDGQARITYASPASARLLGLSPEELQGRSAFEFLHTDDLDRARSRLMGHLASPGGSETAEYRVRYADGSWRSAEVTTTNLFNDQSVGALVLNIRDITEQRRYQDRLEASERRFRALVANSWDIISLHSADGRYLYCSPAVTTQMGVQADAVVGLDPFTFVHRDDAAAVEAFRQVAAGLKPEAKLEYRMPHADGSWRWMESIVHNRLSDPAIAAVVVTTREVTNARRRAAQQGAVAALSSAALRGGPVANLVERTTRTVAEVLEVDRCFVVNDPDDGATRIAPSGLGGWSGGSTPSGRCSLSARAIRERRSVTWTAEAAPAQPGHGRPAACGRDCRSGAATPINSGSGPAGALTVHTARVRSFSPDDLSFLESVANVLAAAITRRQIEEELRRQALHDNLTGLPNRVLIRDRLETALARLERKPGRVAVLFVDVDNFKLVNDNLGHSAGDAVVSAVANRITSAARSADTVARFGGDEFVVISEQTDAEGAYRLAERIRRAVAAPIDLGAQTVSVTSSVGFAVTSDPLIPADDLLAEADMAMYEAKQTGKDCSARFEPRLRARAAEHLDAVSGIRRGLAQDEFRLHFQPIVDTRTGRPVGSEALLRWQQPGGTLVGPAHFIDYAEASGLIIPLGEWVLSRACRQSAEWRRAGVCSHISVNVSGVQLTGSDFVAVVRRVIEESGARPQDISLELTESAVMADLDGATETLKALKDLGVHVGMDDFGTGHSSLSHLARLPFDFVKIDRSFIADFGRDARAAAMLESIATLCRVLRLPAIAEGVETEEQRAHLQHLGLPYLQGFLFGRPVAPEQLSAEKGLRADGRMDWTQ